MTGSKHSHHILMTMMSQATLKTAIRRLLITKERSLRQSHIMRSCNQLRGIHALWGTKSSETTITSSFSFLKLCHDECYINLSKTVIQKRHMTIPQTKIDKDIMDVDQINGTYYSNDDDIKTSHRDMDFYDPLTDDYFYPTSENPGDDGDNNDEEAEEKDAAKRQAIRDEIDTRKGRLWEDPWEITDEDWSSGRTFDDLPDWTEKLCSRVSLERVKVRPDGVPTLDVLAKLKLPTPLVPHPALGDPQKYLKHRRDVIYNHIYKAVVEFAEPKMKNVLSLTNWDDKQDAIDDLFEEVHDAVRYGKDGKNNSIDEMSDDGGYMSIVLGSQPDFPKLVERALEEYLRNVSKDEKNKSLSNQSEEISDAEKEAEPVFIDILKAKDSKLDKDGVPKLLFPLKNHAKDGPGRMTEEWELAAKEDTKRIMCRQCITDIAEEMVKTQGEDSEIGGSRVFVSGRKGAGKSAALASIVASARISGHIVLYLPDGVRLSRQGFYVEPNLQSKSTGKLMFDTPMLSKEVCGQLLTSHEKDLDGMIVSSETLETFLSKDQMKKLEIDDSDDKSVSLVQLLKIGSEGTAMAAGCYSAVIHTLMNQSCKPFTVVMDEFNCYYDRGQYFHQDYDLEVSKPIPLNRITLFQPLLDAVGVEKDDDNCFHTTHASQMKRGSIIVGVTQSNAVKSKFTSDLEAAARNGGCKIVDVPQYSPIEVEHILANFEVTGIGRLRFDRGATVMNSQEVAYLRMVSGGLGQPLLDACVH